MHIGLELDDGIRIRGGGHGYWIDDRGQGVRRFDGEIHEPGAGGHAV